MINRPPNNFGQPGPEVSPVPFTPHTPLTREQLPPDRERPASEGYLTRYSQRSARFAVRAASLGREQGDTGEQRDDPQSEPPPRRPVEAPAYPAADTEQMIGGAAVEGSDWLEMDVVTLVDVGEPVPSHPTKEDLTDFATKTREALQPTWEADPDRLSRPDKDEYPLSYLQCAKSLPQLQQGLIGVEDPIEHHLGALEFGPEINNPAISPHQWLRVGGMDIDITGDQNGPIPVENGVICGTPVELAEAGITYRTAHAWRLTYDNGTWREERIQEAAFDYNIHAPHPPQAE